MIPARTLLFLSLLAAGRLVAAERKLVRRNLELAEANANTRQLLHVLCHDLSNPLCSIASLMELRSAPEFIEEYCPIIANAALTGTGLVSMNKSVNSR